MGKLIGSLFRVFCVLFMVVCLLGKVSLGHANASRVFSGIKKEQGKVKINVKDIPLMQVLEMVNYHSGINFQGYSEHFDKKVTVQIDANTWPEAIRELLIDFGKIEIGDGKNLKSVWLLGGNNSGGPVWVNSSGYGEKGVKSQNLTSKNNKNSIKSASRIPQSSLNSPQLFSKLKQISKLSYNDPIPETLIGDKDLMPFFRQFGIRSASDLKNKKQAHRLKKMAKRRVQAMEEISRSQKSKVN